MITLPHLLRYLHDEGELIIRGASAPRISPYGLDLIREHVRQSGADIDATGDDRLCRLIGETLAYQVLIETEAGEADHDATGPDYTGDIKQALGRH